ncbi:unnamed protein product [Mytilus coruscus]|uniref:Uncharacterized protein n=1 Tax=Mytilus coruscus TaxID=42192 RepID=A0A6J8ECW9_MYTCO|nr:unnamed protein product [Mytilus coruscus]
MISSKFVGMLNTNGVKIALRSLLQNETDNVEKLNQVLPEATENCTKLTPDREEAKKYVIRKASGGLALTGVYDTGNLRDFCVFRKTVIELTKALNLTPPLNENEDETVDFSSQELCNNFHQAMNVIGVNFSGFVRGASCQLCSIESEKDSKTTKEMVETCLNAYIAVHLHVRNIGSEVSAKAFKESGKLSNLYSETDLACTKLKILKRGGPPELDDYYIWKYTLPSCNDTWALIDRG